MKKLIVKQKEHITILRVLGATVRYTAMICIMSHSGIAVEDISKDLGMSHSAVSHQLAILLSAQIVTKEKDGRYMIYRIAKTRAGRAAQRIIKALNK